MGDIGHNAPEALSAGQEGLGVSLPSRRRDHRESVGKKGGPWALAQYDPTHGVLPRRLGPVFATVEEAEWAVFKLRWKKFTGHELAVD